MQFGDMLSIKVPMGTSAGVHGSGAHMDPWATEETCKSPQESCLLFITEYA